MPPYQVVWPDNYLCLAREPSAFARILLVFAQIWPLEKSQGGYSPPPPASYAYFASARDVHNYSMFCFISWQIQGLHVRVNYGVCMGMALTGSLPHTPHNCQEDPVTTTRWSRPTPFRKNRITWLLRDGFT